MSTHTFQCHALSLHPHTTHTHDAPALSRAAPAPRYVGAPPRCTSSIAPMTSLIFAFSLAARSVSSSAAALSRASRALLNRTASSSVICPERREQRAEGAWRLSQLSLARHPNLEARVLRGVEAHVAKKGLSQEPTAGVSRARGVTRLRVEAEPDTHVHPRRVGSAAEGAVAVAAGRPAKTCGDRRRQRQAGRRRRRRR